MSYEDLKQLWQTSSSGSTIELNKKCLQALGSNSIRHKLTETKWSSIIEIAINYIWLYFLAEFTFRHIGHIEFMLPVTILIVIAVYSIVFEAYKLSLFYSINHELSILAAQRKLERLKYLELFDNNSLYIFIPIFFVPFIIVVAQGFFGVDLYEMGFSEREMLYTTLGSFLVSLIIIYSLKKYPNRELQASIDFIQELKDIEQENHRVKEEVS